MNAVALSLVSAVSFALTIFVEKNVITRIKDYFSWAVFTALVAGAAAIALLPLSPEWVSNPLPFAVSGSTTLLGYVLYLKALNRTNPSSVSILLSARPLVSTLFAITLLSEAYSGSSLAWLMVISAAFILFSWNPVDKRDLLSSGLVLSALMVWMVGDSMVKFVSAKGVWFVLGRNLYSFPIALLAFAVARQRMTIPNVRILWKQVIAYFALSLTALTTFFLAAADSFAIANAVSNSMTAVFAVGLGVLVSAKNIKGFGEKWNLKGYAFKAVLAGLIAFSVYQLYLAG